MPIWLTTPATTTIAQSAPAMHNKTMDSGHIVQITTSMLCVWKNNDSMADYTGAPPHLLPPATLLVLWDVIHLFVTVMGVVYYWLLLLSAMVNCCIWILIIPFFLSCRPVSGTTYSIANAVAAGLTITATLPPHWIVLCCMLNIANVSPTLLVFTTATITIIALAVLSMQIQNSLRSKYWDFSQAKFVSSCFDQIMLSKLKQMCNACNKGMVSNKPASSNKKQNHCREGQGNLPACQWYHHYQDWW